ncbi:putative G-protein coupled receptor F59B2.13 [Aphelenchoides besseyi]|nr:putative G-protein coupled receptor F59B2.13 [Aphelenchoides besseyi]KAI6200908.1 putative G-protein coupled receptor F59B2.13 [Aphelenchoides besseyi]
MPSNRYPVFLSSNQNYSIMNANLSALCVPDELLRLPGSQLEHFFFCIIFPPLCIIGVVGNCLNLIVLLNGGSRARRHANHRSNRLLVAMSVCDCAFLLAMIPHSLANFDQFGLNYTFRVFYFTTKIHLISIANWCSATSIWLVIAICTERLLGIRSLLQENSQCSRCTTAHLIAMIVFVAGLLTFYKHFSHFCIIKKELCENTQVICKCFDIIQEEWPGNRTNMTPMAIKSFVRWMTVANAVFVIFIPIVIMIVLNVALLIVVRKQSFLVYKRLSLEQHFCADKRESVGNARTAIEQLNKCEFRKNVDQNSQFHVEHRVTVTVAAIVTCFTLTQGPSAIILWLSFLYGHKYPYISSNLQYYNVSSSTGFLVIIGKTLNFVLFCLSSTAFRSRLLTILDRKIGVLLGTQNSFFATSNPSSVRKYSHPNDRRQSLAV